MGMSSRKEGPAISQFAGQANPCRPSREDEAVQFAKFLNGRGVVDDLRIHLEVAKHAPFAVRPLAPVVNNINHERFVSHAAHSPGCG